MLDAGLKKGSADLRRKVPNLFVLAMVGAFALLVSCARFEPRPISPADNAAKLENRSLQNPALRPFVEACVGRQFEQWPPEIWDTEMIAAAALYYHPSLELVRAQWSVAKGGRVTAGERPNPVLTVTPTYNVTTLSPSPWVPVGSVDFHIETAGKRGHRKAQAAQLAEAARLKIVAAAWQVRGRVRSVLVDVDWAEQRQQTIQEQVALQEQIVRAIEQQVQAGALAASEATTFRIALARARLDLVDAQSKRSEARVRLSESMGILLRP